MPIYPRFDPATGEYYFKGQWYPDYPSVRQAIDDYEKAKLDALEAREAEEKIIKKTLERKRKWA